MKILRSVSRRGFSVGTAGWFTVLRPNTWFPASRLPKAHPALGTRADGAVEQVSKDNFVGFPSGDAKAVRWMTTEQRAEDRNRVRRASAIFGALAITSAMLWWIMHP